MEVWAPTDLQLFLQFLQEEPQYDGYLDCNTTVGRLKLSTIIAKFLDWKSDGAIESMHDVHENSLSNLKQLLFKSALDLSDALYD